MKTPDFWYREKTFGDFVKMVALLPFSYVYGAIQKEFNKQNKQYDPKIPVICVGNLVAGGAGKTPTVMALYHYLQKKGKKPHVISRGYRALLTDPTKVDPAVHRVIDVGDEPLMMAKAGLNVWICPNRAKSAYEAAKAGADVIIMDDGHQNFSMKKTVSLVVIDGLLGFGNKKLLPAGPLREPIKQGLSRADAVVILGNDETQVDTDISLPILRGQFVPTENIIEGMNVFGFAGMGRPEKFINTLYDMNARITGFDSFPDHYEYTVLDIEMLSKKANAADSILVTTRKDFMRIPDTHQHLVNVVDVVLKWDNEALWDSVLAPVFSASARSHAKKG